MCNRDSYYNRRRREEVRSSVQVDGVLHVAASTRVRLGGARVDRRAAVSVAEVGGRPAVLRRSDGRRTRRLPGAVRRRRPETCSAPVCLVTTTTLIGVYQQRGWMRGRQTTYTAYIRN